MLSQRVAIPEKTVFLLFCKVCSNYVYYVIWNSAFDQYYCPNKSEKLYASVKKGWRAFLKVLNILQQSNLKDITSDVV